MKRFRLASLAVVFFFIAVSWGRAVEISEATGECLDCHADLHPGIVSGWEKSRHAKVSPGQAMAVSGMARKVSAEIVPEALRNFAVGCAECHMLRPDAHADTFDHNGHSVHVVVTPDDCATCHPQERKQFSENLMSRARGNLSENKLYGKFLLTVLGKPVRKTGRVVFEAPGKAQEADGCYYCHGTLLSVTGSRTRQTDAGELSFPVIDGWPNQGVGRENPDGSLGSCSACHTRHLFSIEMARKPHTCKECHVGPDVPAFKVYSASKHGNIYSSMKGKWNFDAVPWTIGTDFTAPTCAACHISLLANKQGEEVVKRTHRMNDRLPFRIYGLIYAHPHPESPDTTIIRNVAGLPLPTGLDGSMADKYLIGEAEMATRRQAMQAACRNCHGTSWVSGHWRQMEAVIGETNHAVRCATQILEEVWAEGLAVGLSAGGNPFDEAVEKMWSDVWLLYANTIRFSSAMACGGDYGVYAGGRYQMTRRIQELSDWLAERKRGVEGGAGN